MRATIIRVSVPDGYGDRLRALAERVGRNVPAGIEGKAYQAEADQIVHDMLQLAKR